MTLDGLLADAARRVPARPALLSGAESVTYRELDELVDERAKTFARGEVVALPLPNTIEAVARLHGALRAGAVAVPLGPLLSEREQAQRRDAFQPHPDAAVVLFTSGSTGEPKRIELSHEALRRNAEYLAHTGLGLRETDVLYGAAPLSHVFGLTGCLHAAFAAGAAVALVARFDADEALSLLEDDVVTVFLGVPAMCSALVAASARTASSARLRLAHVGGAPLPAQVRAELEGRFGTTVLEGYGMTEVGGVVTLQHAGRRSAPGSVGTPAAGTELRIADDGEILVRSPTMMLDGGEWLATGDIGRLDEHGELFLVDRKKDVILRGGYTVYPREVEAVLRTHPGVRDALVVGVPDGRLGEEVAALVVAEGSTAEELREHARAQLAAYKYPRLVVLVDRLPQGPTGKVDRRAIDRAALAGLLAAPAERL